MPHSSDFLASEYMCEYMCNFIWCPHHAGMNLCELLQIIFVERENENFIPHFHSCSTDAKWNSERNFLFYGHAMWFTSKNLCSHSFGDILWSDMRFYDSSIWIKRKFINNKIGLFNSTLKSLRLTYKSWNFITFL